MKSKSRFISKERLEQITVFLKHLKIDFKTTQLNNKEIELGLNLINEALTHTSAEREINHEKLEFLGDAVLRLAASEFIERKYPSMKVGDRSALRSQLVSDEWLSKVGEKEKIYNFFLIGTKATGDPSAKATLNAEATEAIIGAIYAWRKDLEPIHRWLSPYWEETSKTVMADPHMQNAKSALQEWSQQKGFQLPHYDCKETCQSHGNPRRFFCRVQIEQDIVGEGWGSSRKAAEKEAARVALNELAPSKNS